MKVNGEVISLSKEMTLTEFLNSQNYNTGRIAVERNGDIVPKAHYDTTLLSDADTLEVVHFVGGG